ncbi:MAG: heavy-metal-associated domain-containing protein [Haloarculaceae archaeon]
MDPQAATGRVSVTYDPELVSADDVVGRGEAAGFAVEGVADRSDRATFEVPEMDCPSCTGKVETALVAAEGVEAVEIRPTAGTVLVPYDPDVATPEDLREAIEGADIALAVLAGDAGMTVGVTANAMRLSRLRPKGGTGASSPATD